MYRLRCARTEGNDMARSDVCVTLSHLIYLCARESFGMVYSISKYTLEVLLADWIDCSHSNRILWNVWWQRIGISSDWDASQPMVHILVVNKIRLENGNRTSNGRMFWVRLRVEHVACIFDRCWCVAFNRRFNWNWNATKFKWKTLLTPHHSSSRENIQ